MLWNLLICDIIDGKQRCIRVLKDLKIEEDEEGET